MKQIDIKGTFETDGQIGDDSIREALEPELRRMAEFNGIVVNDLNIVISDVNADADQSQSQPEPSATA